MIFKTKKFDISHNGVNNVDGAVGRRVCMPSVDMGTLPVNNLVKKYKSGLLCITNTNDAVGLFNFIYYHKCIVKFDRIVILDNQATVNLQKICGFFEGVDYFDTREFKSQPFAYNEYISGYNECEWLLCIDDDEYLYLSDKYDGINDYLASQGHMSDKIGIPWVLMYLPKNTEYNPENVATDAVFYNPREHEYEENNWLWNSSFTKTLFNTDGKHVLFCEDNTSHEFLKPEQFIDERFTGFSHDAAIEYGGYRLNIDGVTIDDVMGNVHNPLVFTRDKKLLMTRLAYDNKYIFGFRRTDDNNVIRYSDISILHYKYQSESYYRDKIKNPRFTDCVQLYYERNYTMENYFRRYGADFEVFTGVRDKILNSNYFNELQWFKTYYYRPEFSYTREAGPVKYAVVTAIFNNYDLLREPYAVDPDCEYICLTDNPALRSDTWKIVLENDTLRRIGDPRQKTYYVRYHLNEFSKSFYTVWCDASIQIKRSFKPFIREMDQFDVGIIVYDYSHDTVKKYVRRLDMITHDSPEVVNYNRQKLADFLIEKCVDVDGHGLYNAGIRICKNTKFNTELDNLVYDTLHGVSDTFYYDEIVYSYIINGMPDIKVYPLHNCIIYSDFCIKYQHNTRIPCDLDDSNCLPYNNYRLPYFINKKMYMPLKVNYVD